MKKMMMIIYPRVPPGSETFNNVAKTWEEKFFFLNLRYILPYSIQKRVRERKTKKVRK